MKLYTKYIYFSFLMTLFVSCEENELDPLYKGDSRIVLSGDATQGARQDSILFSFAVYDAAVQQTEILIQAQTMGNLSSSPRILRLEADKTLTTAQDSEYSFPETVTILPGNIRATIPVELKRSSRLQDGNTKLVIKVVENDDFLPGPKVPGSLVNSGPSFNIVWNDQLTKPPYWDPSGTQSLRWVWGDWSKKKHQLIIDLTGIRDFSVLTTAQKYNIQAVGLAYLASNGPVVSEQGNVIGFCSNCN